MPQVRNSIRGPFKVKNSDFWYVEIRGKRRSLKTDNKEEAERIIAEIKAKDTLARIELAPKKGMPLFRFKKKYLDWSEGIHTEGTTEINENSLRKLEDHVSQERDIIDITQEDADTMISNLSKKGNSPTYCNIILRHCRSAFQKAVEWGYIDSNPFSKVKPLAVEKRPPEWIESDEITPFLKTIKDQDFKLLIAAYLFTGRRRVELLRLTWKDVDFERGRYYIQGKSHLSRWFPISESFRNILEYMPRNGDGRIWHRWNSERYITHKAKKALRAAGFGHLHLHHLRHSFATNYLDAGGEIAVLQDLLGHTDIKCTLIYGKITSKLAKMEVDRVGIDLGALS